MSEKVEKRLREALGEATEHWRPFRRQKRGRAEGACARTPKDRAVGGTGVPCVQRGQDDEVRDSGIGPQSVGARNASPGKLNLISHKQ